MDRCHRIGQTKPVHVYRLATAQSIEVLHGWCCSSFIIKRSNIILFAMPKEI